MEVLFPTPINTAGRVIEVAYDASRQYLAAISEQTMISIWQRPYKEEEWLLASRWTVDSQAGLTKLAWADPSFGSLLSVVSSSGDVLIWDNRSRLSEPLAETPSPGHLQSTIKVGRPVKALAFAPKAHGLQLAIATDVGIRLYTPSVSNENAWVLENDIENADQEACTSISWKPHSENVPPMLLGGSSNGAKIWLYETALMRWLVAMELPIRQPVSCVAWANALGRPTELVAVASGKTATLYSLSGPADALQVLVAGKLEHAAPITSIQWNLLGNSLAATTQGAEVLMWRADLLGCWKTVHCIKGVPYSEMQ